MQVPQGTTGKRKFAVTALLTFLLFAGFFVTAQRAAADTGSSDLNPAGEVAAPPAPVPPATTTVQGAATGQIAAADAAAVETAQSNSLAATRTDSSGGEGVSQENDSTVAGAAANGAATSQGSGSGSPPPTGSATETDQQSATDQAANASAAAVQPQQSNVVIIIRINSPGDDVVSQTNVVSVVAVGANQSSTSQNSGLPGGSASGATDPGPSDPNGASPGGASGQAAQPPNAAPQQQPQTQPAQPVAAQPVAAQPVAAQPAQSSAVLQQQQPEAGALRILAWSATSNANPPAAEGQKVSPTKSATHLRRGGARGRSGASASRTLAPLQTDGSSNNSTPAGKARGAARSTGAHDSAGPKLDAARDRPGSWLSRARLAPPSQIAVNAPGGGTNFGLATLAALLAGLLGWGALTWLPPARGSPWRGARG